MQAAEDDPSSDSSTEEDSDDDDPSYRTEDGDDLEAPQLRPGPGSGSSDEESADSAESVDDA